METLSSSLREREAAKAAVSRSLEKAAAGEGNALFLLGGAGLGKTSLLTEAAAAAQPAFDVTQGRGERMEAVIPFGVAEDLFAALADEADGGLLGDRPAIEPSVPYLRFLRRLEAGDRPRLILLDDLHWADQDSLSLVAFLVRRLARLPVAIIAALRPWPAEAHEVVQSLARHGAVIQELAPLGRESTEALLAEASNDGAPAADLVERAWGLTGGNPLLVGLVSRLLTRDGDLPPWLCRADHEAGHDLPAVPEDPTGDPDQIASGVTEGLLLSRFAGLDEQGMRLARCAAVAGVSFRPNIAVAAAGLSARQAETALEALFQSGLISDDEPGFLRFAHPLFEQALYGQIAPPVRRRLHARIFELLVEGGFEREAADHAIRGEMIGSAAAGAALERIGIAALAAGAVAGAADKLGWAVRIHADRCPPRLLLNSARALIAGGRADEAAATVERMLKEGERIEWKERVAALRTLGQARYLAGSPDLGDRHMTEAVAITEKHDPQAAVRPLLDQATIAWMGAGPVAALPLAERARKLATEGDEDLRLAADALWGHLALESGDRTGLAAVEPVGRRLATGDAARLLSPAELVWPAAAIYGYAHSAKYAERLDESLAALKLARDALVDAGAANGIATVTLFIGNQLVRRGRLSEALHEADRAEEFSELTPLTRPFAPLIRAEAMAWMGRFEESRAQCEAALDQMPGSGLWAVTMWAGLVRGQCLLWQGDNAASDRFLELEYQAHTVGLVEPSSQPWAAYAVAAHLAAERRTDAARVTENLEALSIGMTSRWTAALAALSRGRLLEYDGRLDLAESSYRQALERLAQVDLPLLRAEIELTLGGLIRRSGRSVEARRSLGEACRLAESLGASQLAGRATSELHLAGGRRRRPAENRDILTPAERRVAAEVAAGLTNAEVARRLHISGNTVATHLKRVYGKLGINSRRQLIELGIRTDPGENRPQD